MNTLPPENQLLKYEEQYEAAGWETTLRAMALTGDYLSHTLPVGVEERILSEEIPTDEIRKIVGYLGILLCLHAKKDTSSVLPVIQNILQEPHLSRDRNDLHIAGLCVTDGTQHVVNPQLATAHMLYYSPDDSIAREIAEEVNLKRFDEDVAIYSAAYSQSLVDAHKDGVSISSRIKNITRDSIFYIGRDDTETGEK